MCFLGGDLKKDSLAQSREELCIRGGLKNVSNREQERTWKVEEK